jgi:hypothetical protein
MYTSFGIGNLVIRNRLEKLDVDRRATLKRIL